MPTTIVCSYEGCTKSVAGDGSRCFGHQSTQPGFEDPLDFAPGSVGAGMTKAERRAFQKWLKDQ